MKTARKILLIVSIIVVALIDQLYAIVYCSKRVGFFRNLFDLLPDIAMIPLLIGLLLGVYFGLDELSWDVFVRATAVSCVALTGQGLLTAVICIPTCHSVSAFLDSLLIFPICSLVFGLSAAAAGMIITLAVKAIVKYIIKRRYKYDEA